RTAEPYRPDARDVRTRTAAYRSRPAKSAHGTRGGRRDRVSTGNQLAIDRGAPDRHRFLRRRNVLVTDSRLFASSPYDRPAGDSHGSAIRAAFVNLLDIRKCECDGEFSDAWSSPLDIRRVAARMFSSTSARVYQA